MSVAFYCPKPDYNSPRFQYAMSIADCLARSSQTVFVLHETPIDSSVIPIRFYGINFKQIEPQAPAPQLASPSLKRLRQTYELTRSLTSEYDTFISVESPVPVFNHAVSGGWIPEFPESKRPYTIQSTVGLWNNLLLRWYNRLEWNSRFTGYKNIFVPSLYAQKWLYKRYKLWSTVLPPAVLPPVEIIPAEKKSPVIGLFAPSQKIEELLIQQFNKLIAHTHLDVSIQPINQTDSIESIRTAINSCSIIWDAAGWGTNLTLYPQQAGAFPYYSAYAMASGTVPITFCAGAATEVIIHQKSGFIWQTIPELLAYTLGLFQDPNLRYDLSALCLTRSQLFGQNLFDKKVASIFKL